MSIILHITPRTEWERALLADGMYRADSLESEGFIHCSTPAQLVRTANKYYRGKDSLVLLVINPDNLESELKYERAPNVEADIDPMFPHIYGPLNASAVSGVLTFEPSADGTFAMPTELQGMV